MIKLFRVRSTSVFFSIVLTSLSILGISCSKKDDVVPEPFMHSTPTMAAISRSAVSAPASANGSISLDTWSNVGGNDVSNIPASSTPTSTTTLSNLEIAQTQTANFGDRIRGYIYAPVTGQYTFWISGDDAAELWLSTDDNAANKVKIANTVSWTNFREWSKYASQKSAVVNLTAGKAYYIEVLHKQGGGSGHVSVAWQIPGQGVEAPIPGSRLSTYTAASNSSSPTLGTALCQVWNNVQGNTVGDIPVNTTPSASTSITSLEQTSSQTANYGKRIRAYIYPPTTGNYTFWVSGDDATELWVSIDDDPNDKVKVAYTLSYTNFREWTKYSTQQSAQVALKAGQRYYIEVLQKQAAGDGHVSVQWQLPDNTIECPVPGSRLSPYNGSTTTTTTNSTPSSSTTARTYTPSPVINLVGAHDLTIDGKSIVGGSVPAISLKNCQNIHITNCKLYNSSDVGVYLLNCKNITVDYNYITNVSTGVYVDQASQGGIVVNNNQFYNMQGPFPRGQFVQFNNVNGAGSSVSYNKGENILGSSTPEDAINMYQSNGTASSPIQIVGNWIRGGGPSSSGGAILLGDNGGSYQYAANNIIVNSGEYGMGIAGGDHQTIQNNTIYSKSQSFSNVGIYVNSINGYATTNASVSTNKVRFYNNNNYLNSCWLSTNSNCQKPSGWDTGNVWSANVDETILPATIITYKDNSTN